MTEASKVCSATDQHHLEERSLAAAERQAKAAEEQTFIARRGLQTAWVGLILGFIGLGATLLPLTRSNRVVAAELVAAQLTITSLTNGAAVGINELVHGATPYPDRNHYVVVTPLRTGDSYVQVAATLHADKTWTGNALFGSGSVGLQEKFTVRCLATQAELRMGTLASQPLPSDAVFSPAVTVVRTH